MTKQNIFYSTFILLGFIVVGGLVFFRSVNTTDAQVGRAWYKAATSGVIAVTSDAQILASSSRRGYASICNDSANVVYLGLDQDKPLRADGLNVGHRLNANGGCLEIVQDEGIYFGSIRASSTNETSSNLIIREHLFF